MRFNCLLYFAGNSIDYAEDAACVGVMKVPNGRLVNQDCNG